MKIAPTLVHGRLRWRVNVQRGSYRRRLFFASREKALAFAAAAGTPVTLSELPPPIPAPASAPATVTTRQPATVRAVRRPPRERSARRRVSSFAAEADAGFWGK